MTEYQQKQRKEFILVDSLRIQSNMEAAIHIVFTEEAERSASAPLAISLVGTGAHGKVPPAVMADLQSYIQSLQNSLTCMILNPPRWYRDIWAWGSSAAP